MRWLTYFILAYVTLGLQLGLGAHLQFRGGSPNLPLLVVVFISLNAPRDEAMLGSLLLGAMQDLVTLEPMGLYALSYGLVAILISSAGQLTFREHPLTHVFMTLISGIVTSTVLLVHGWIHPLGPAQHVGDTVIRAVHQSPRLLAVTVIYTALLAPIVLGFLQRIQRTFSFDQPRRRMR
jgi:rod shape-determining protein MreD